jgi:hypothetical protein
MRAAVAWIGIVAACGAATASSAPRLDLTADAALPRTAGLHVERNRLVDHGATVRLLGVNHSGTEYACIKGAGIFEGPQGDSLVSAIASWHANTIRIPLNEDCWLGLNGLDTRFAGAEYRAAIARFVGELRAGGLYVVVDLHWAAPHGVRADTQLPMADADHAVDFWRSVAETFRSDSGVLFDLFNEPFLDTAACATSSGASVEPWRCLRDGCVVSVPNTYRTAGAQMLLDAIRSADAHNVVLVPGLGYSSDLSHWLEHAPRDPLGQIGASVHLYNFSGCHDAECFSRRYDAVAAAVPLVAGEIGENDCAHGFVDNFMTWADRRGGSYLGWAWNTWDCERGPALIQSYDGTPTAYGEGLRHHLAPN